MLTKQSTHRNSHFHQLSLAIVFFNSVAGHRRAEVLPANMSGSSEFSHQKPSFSQKCGLLSQYLKEKGSFGDLSLGMTCSTESAATATTMSLFPQQSGFVSKEAVPKMAESRSNKTAQMTIFYAGQVIVLDDLPADKAKEVMLFASNGVSLKHNSFASTPARSPAEALPGPVQENAQRPVQPIVCDLPIARRASLHRFLEKRKDRIMAKPYQQNSPATSKPVEESKPWMGLGGQSTFHC